MHARTLRSACCSSARCMPRSLWSSARPEARGTSPSPSGSCPYSSRSSSRIAARTPPLAHRPSPLPRTYWHRCGRLTGTATPGRRYPRCCSRWSSRSPSRRSSTGARCSRSASRRSIASSAKLPGCCRVCRCARAKERGARAPTPPHHAAAPTPPSAPRRSTTTPARLTPRCRHAPVQCMAHRPAYPTPRPDPVVQAQARLRDAKRAAGLDERIVQARPSLLSPDTTVVIED